MNHFTEFKFWFVIYNNDITCNQIKIDKCIDMCVKYSFIWRDPFRSCSFIMTKSLMKLYCYFRWKIYHRKRSTRNFHSYISCVSFSHVIKILKSASLYKITNMFFVIFAIFSAKHRRRAYAFKFKKKERRKKKKHNPLTRIIFDRSSMQDCCMRSHIYS